MTAATIPSAFPAPIGQVWDWQGYPIYYVQAGTPRRDRPPLLLIHGFGASTDHWRKNIQGLQGDFEVWAIDLLGFGRSTKADTDYSGLLWANQLQAFVHDVIGRPAVLVGNSLGGYASLCVAAHYPDAVAGVILLNSAGPFSSNQPAAPVNPFRTAVNQTLRTILLQPFPSWLLFQYVRQRSVIRKTLQKVYLDHTAITDDLIEAIRRPADDPGAVTVFAAVFKAQQGATVDTLLASMTAPLLLLWGEADPWMDCRLRSEQFRRHYDSVQEAFLQAGHCPHDEVPQQVNPLVRDWVLHTICNHDSPKAVRE